MSALGIIITIILVALCLYEIVSLVLAIKKKKDVKKKKQESPSACTVKVDEITTKEEEPNECNIN